MWVDGTHNFRLKHFLHLHIVAAWSSDESHRSMKGAIHKEMEKKQDNSSLSKTDSILLAEKIARFAQIKILSYLTAMCGLKQ